MAGSPQACTAFVYTAIRQRRVITATPAACAGLSGAQVNQAVGTAVRMTLTSGTKADKRRQAVAAAAWAQALITAPVPAGAPGASPDARPQALAAGGPSGGGRGLGGVGELAAQIGALLAWLATAASGGWVLVRWLLAGGSPRRGSATAAPPAVILGHVGAAVLGLLVWAAFMASGWTVLGWTALGLLAPVSGSGMSLLALGLPGPGRAGLTGPPGPFRMGGPSRMAGTAGRRPRMPVLAVIAHGIFAVAALLLVLMATIGAG